MPEAELLVLPTLALTLPAVIAGRDAPHAASRATTPTDPSEARIDRRDSGERGLLGNWATA